MRKLSKALVLATGMLAGMFAGAAAHAQDWPNRTVTLMVGFSPGGGTDVTARLFAHKLSEELGQSVVVENRAGASGNIAAEDIAKAAPDGYRILMIASGTFINNTLSSKPRYSVVNDLAPIAFVTMSPLVMVAGPTTKATTVQELIEEARSKPNGLSFSSDGVGATGQLAGELFKSMTNANLLHVPFKGSSEATTAIAGGQVDLGFPSLSAAFPLLQSGKVRALAVTSLERSPLLPDVPSLNEAGLKGFDVIGWFALMGPVGTPRPVMDRINAALEKIAEQPDVKASLAKQGLVAQLRSPEGLAKYLQEQSALISDIAKKAEIKID